MDCERYLEGCDSWWLLEIQAGLPESTPTHQNCMVRFVSISRVAIQNFMQMTHRCLVAPFTAGFLHAWEIGVAPYFCSSISEKMPIAVKTRIIRTDRAVR